MEACGILWHPAYWVETMQVLVKSLTGKRTKFNVQQRTTIGVVPSILLFTLCGDDEGGVTSAKTAEEMGRFWRNSDGSAVK